MRTGAVDLWRWAAKWPWWTIFVSGALGAMIKAGEYVGSVLLMAIAAFAAVFKIAHSNIGWVSEERYRPACKVVGILGVVVFRKYILSRSSARALGAMAMSIS